MCTRTGGSAQERRERLPQRQCGGDGRLGSWLPSCSSVQRRGRAGEVSPGPEPVLVRWPGPRGQARLRAHRGPPRGRGARSDFLPMLRHGDGAHRLHVTLDRHARGQGLGTCWKRRARPLRRQPQRQDHVQGGAAARDCACPPIAPRVPVHARWRWRRGRVRVKDQPAAATDRARHLQQPMKRTTAYRVEPACSL